MRGRPAEGRLKTAEERASASARETADLQSMVREDLGRLTALSERGVALMEGNTRSDRVDPVPVSRRRRDAGVP